MAALTDVQRLQARVEELERWVYGPGTSRGSRKVSGLGSGCPVAGQSKMKLRPALRDGDSRSVPGPLGWALGIQMGRAIPWPMKEEG